MSSIFDLYPTVYYPLDIKGQTILKKVSDITSNVRLTQKAINNTLNYDHRVLGDGESFEIVANEVYQDPTNHVLVMLANDMFDWRDDVPLTPIEFQSMINEKYSDPNGIHHYEDVDGNIVDNLWDEGDEQNEFAYPKNIIPITNYDYEMRINEAKRVIKVIKPQHSSLVNGLIKEKLQRDEQRVA